MIQPMPEHNLPRVIRVFVSSTFRDMQAERDYLVKFIFPQLRKLCESRGVTWGEVDLRWASPMKRRPKAKCCRSVLRKFIAAVLTLSAC